MNTRLDAAAGVREDFFQANAADAILLLFYSTYRRGASWLKSRRVILENCSPLLLTLLFL
jgi:hypothetical protein